MVERVSVRPQSKDLRLLFAMLHRGQKWVPSLASETWERISSNHGDLGALPKPYHDACGHRRELNQITRRGFAVQLDGFLRNLSVGLSTARSQSQRYKQLREPNQ